MEFKAPGTDLYLVLSNLAREGQNPVAYFQVFKATDISHPAQQGQIKSGQSVNIQGNYDLNS